MLSPAPLPCSAAAPTTAVRSANAEPVLFYCAQPLSFLQLAVAETEDSALLRPRWLQVRGSRFNFRGFRCSDVTLMQCIGFNRINIIQVACGEGHSMALGADGEVGASSRVEKV
jgi:hypothetical protein